MSLLMFLIWGLFQMRTSGPIVDLRVAARPQVLFTNLASIAVGFAMYGYVLTLPQLLMAPESTGYGLGMSMISTGLAWRRAGS